MQITVNGKPVYPQRKPGMFAAGFHKERDGSLIYVEYPVNDKGRPDKAHPMLVAEIGKDQVEQLEAILARRQPKETPQSLRARAEVLEALQKLDEIRKTQNQR